MDSKLLEYYNRELAYLREMARSSPSSTRRSPGVWACAASTWRIPILSG
ncbi:Uncharacterised protein [Serratia rubidaea]|uniref:Uncharacterized protein n=1 Tax=Serratia rubidaea TaxID=61652 RepID=A0A4U9HJV0_SERRU|nr:Uncharacterised protein [Serratia rubidaea]